MSYGFGKLDVLSLKSGSYSLVCCVTMVTLVTHLKLIVEHSHANRTPNKIIGSHKTHHISSRKLGLLSSDVFCRNLFRSRAARNSRPSRDGAMKTSPQIVPSFTLQFVRMRSFCEFMEKQTRYMGLFWRSVQNL